MIEWPGWRRIIRLAFTKRHAEQQVDDELRFHTESLVERLVAEGKSEDEARREVTERFLGYRETRDELTRRRQRQVAPAGWRHFLETLAQDLRISLRALVRRPWFTGLGALTVGLGIGAFATLLSVVDGVLLSPLPYPESRRLVHIGTSRFGGPPDVFTAPEFLALRATTRTLEAYAAYRNTNLSVSFAQQPIRLTANAVTEDYFDVFGVPPVLGREFVDDDFGASGEPVMIVSFRIWQQQFGADSSVVGTVVQVAGSHSPAQSSRTVVGVMPRDFASSADLWIPERLAGTWWEGENMFTNSTHSSVGRLAAGRRVEDVQTEVAALAATLAAEYPQHYSGRYYDGRGIGALSLLDRTVVGYRRSILLVTGAALLLLLIAVTNVAGLYLTRMLDRTEEVAIRSSLGAGRWRIARQYATEATLLCLLGCALGVFFAVGGVQAFRLLAPLGFPRIQNVTVGGDSVLSAVGIAVLTGLFSGTLPVLMSNRRDLANALKAGARVAPDKNTTRIRSALIVVQVAVAAYLLVGSGLLATNYLRLLNVDPGVDTDGLLVMPIQIPGRYQEEIDAYTSFLHATVRRIEAVAGVESASWTPDPPLYGGWWHPEVTIEGMDSDAEATNVRTHPVGPNYFRTVGVPILDGRGITPHDDSENQLVAVVDEMAARRFWPSESPLGKRLSFGPDDDEGRWHTIVGVVGYTHERSVAQQPTPQFYVPALQRTQPYGQSRIVIRSALAPTTLAPMLRSAVWDVDPAVPAAVLESASDRLAADLRDPRFYSVLVGFFSITAVAVTLTGVYALMMYLVTGRRLEMGIRSALGARRLYLVWNVSRHCSLLISGGLLAGMALAAATSKLLNALLFAVSPTDEATFVAVAAGMGFCALAACLVPALRATRVEPAVALRAD